jgi:DNA polymerase
MVGHWLRNRSNRSGDGPVPTPPPDRSTGPSASSESRPEALGPGAILASAGFPEQVLVLDFETFHDTGYTLAELPIPQYVHDERFRVLGLAVRWPDGHCAFRRDVENVIAECTERFGEGWDAVAVAGHNWAFDGYILRTKYGVTPRHTVDTLSLARHVWPGWGNSLEQLADRYGLLSKGDIAAKLKGVRDLSPEQDADLAAYAKHDAELTYELLLRLLPQITRSDVELRIIDHTLRLFIERSVHLDTLAAESLRDEATREVDRVLNDAGLDRSAAGGDKFVELLAAELAKHGEVVTKKPGKKGPIPALAKQDEGMKQLLGHESPRVRSLARARLAVKSIPAFEKRINALITCANATNGVIPVPLIYFGAHTGRFSGGGGINLQNLPVRAEGLAPQLRGLIVPAEGHHFVIVDADKIEARVLAWVAGQNDLVRIFAEGRDVYSEFASTIFSETVRKPRPDDPPDLKTKLASRRQLGKTSILGLGYAMGEQTFIKSVRKDRALAQMLEAGALTEELLVRTHGAYRRTYPAIPRFWRAVEAAFRQAVSRGEGKAHGVVFVRSGDAVYVELPSGRKLIYRKPVVATSGELAYVAKRCRKKDGRIEEVQKRLFGGLLTENIVQAISRDALVDAILGLEEKELEVVLHVHDEIVVQVLTEQAEQALVTAEQQLSATPDWARGLPLAAEGHVADRYGK